MRGGIWTRNFWLERYLITMMTGWEIPVEDSRLTSFFLIYQVGMMTDGKFTTRFFYQDPKSQPGVEQLRVRHEADQHRENFADVAADVSSQALSFQVLLAALLDFI